MCFVILEFCIQKKVYIKIIYNVYYTNYNIIK